MADRTVKVQLTAQVQGYLDGMEKAAKATNEVGSASEKLAEQKRAFEMLGASAMAMGAAAAVGVGLAVSKWADFDQAMSNVQAATHESEENMELLSNAALDAGARTVFSAEESANAIEELAKAGVSTADILSGGLDGALDLAAAGGLGVAEAAGIAATALKTFNLEGSDMAHVADLLAAGAGKAMGDVTDLSGALNQSSMVAHATGLSIEETTGTLAAFASQGLIGSDAGTSFKSMLQSLTPTSAKARETMDELGISAYDAQGNFIGMAEFAGNLQNGLKDLSVEQQQAALKTIFGSDAIRAATVLYNEGEEGIRDWTEAVDDQGYAADTAAARLDNLKGDIEALGGALDTALIKTGEGADGPLREMVKWLTESVDAYNELPAPMQSTAMALGIVAAGVGLLGGGMMIAIPKVAAYQAAIATLGPVAQRTAGALGAVGKSAGVMFAVIAAATAADSMANWTAEAMGAAKSSEHFAEKLEKLGASADIATDALTGGGWGDSLRDEAMVAQSHLDQLMTDVGNTSADLQNSMIGGVISFTSTVSSLGMTTGKELGQAKENIGALDKAMAEMVDSGNADEARAQFDQLTAMTDGTDASLAKLTKLFPEYMEAQYGGAEASEDGAAAIDEVAVAADAAAGELDEMKAALDGVAGATMSMSEAKDAALSAINGLTEAAKAEGATLEGADNASISLRDSMRDVEISSRDSATAILENKGSMEEAMAAWQLGRDKVIGIRVAMGESQEQAVAWADQNLGSASEVSLAMNGVKDAVNGIPDGKNIDLTVSGNALAKIQEINSWLSSTPETKHISISGTGGISGLANGGIFEDKVKTFAAGGFEPGIYPYTSGGIHKFAEEYDEGYVSLDPARHDRSVGVWQELGNRLGQGGGGRGNQAPVPVQISLAGASFVASIDGRPITLMIQEQIASADRAGGTTVASGIGRDY